MLVQLATATPVRDALVRRVDGTAARVLSPPAEAGDCQPLAGSDLVPGRVLVTGAAGFIGSHLVDALLCRGHEVVAVDRRPLRGGVTAAANPAASTRLVFHTADLSTDRVDDLVAGCDTVFHLAAVPGVRRSWGERFETYVASNIIGTHRLLVGCERAGVRRLVFASSSSVYGAASGPSREDDATHPVSPYGVSKLAAEQLCLAYAKRAGSALTSVALRYFTVYGPRQRPDMAIGRVLRAGLSGAPVELYGDGTQRREFTYVSDVVDATIAAASADAPDAAVVNVGGGSSVSMREVIRLAGQVTGRPVPVLRRPSQPGDVPATRADLTLARKLLGYRPTVDLRTGMARQAAWLAEYAPAPVAGGVPVDLEVSR